MIVSKASKIEKIIYWTGVSLIAAIFLLSGYLQITNPISRTQYISSGYPAHFTFLLGCFNIAGVVGLLMPPDINWIKEWAFAGFVFEMIFAFVASCLGNNIISFWPPVAMFIVVLNTYIMFRKLNPFIEVPNLYGKNSEYE